MENIARLFDWKKFTNTSFVLPLLVMLILAMMVLPIPVFLLDILFTFNISLSLIVLLCCIYAKQALDFTAFPTVLLIATLLRLSLNVASTRVVLLNGHNGADAAGQVIKSFGEVVIGSSYAVGIIVFIILVIINFVVVTKGGSRISEVSARFTLDSMPGKQMAVDADLNAGAITQEEAKQRRQEIMQESDFYGAMDGASKFVRGDAIAGLLILFINILGGIIIGMSEYAMSFSNAAKTYTLLTIGDGLVAQVPSLLLSIAAAMIVSRVNNTKDISRQTSEQLFSQPKTLFITAFIIGLLGIIPGMPHLSFIALALVILLLAYSVLNNQNQRTKKIALEEKRSEPMSSNQECDWNDVKPMDMLSLEIGYRLINLADNEREGQLLKRVKALRKQLSQQLGFLIPAVHVKDNLTLSPNQYRILLMGVNVGGAEILPDKLLAINPGQVFGTLDGTACKDPAFGLTAVWVNQEQRDYAQSLGYTVVDASTVIATHLSQVMQTHSYELLGHEEVQQLLKQLAQTYPKLAESLVPGVLSLNIVVRVLQKCLEEKVSIADLRTIAEALIDAAPKSQDPEILTGYVRIALRRMIFQTIAHETEVLEVAMLSPKLEQILQQSIKITQESGGGIEPTLAEKIINSLYEYHEQQQANGQNCVLVVSPQIRAFLAKLCRSTLSFLHVLSYQEIPDNKQVKIIKSIGHE